MSQSRVNNSAKNISSGFIAQIIQMVLGFVSRTVFIWYLSAEYLGVSSLFSNILTMLALAEMGITSAFIFELYKPLANKNQTEITSIMHHFKKVYHWIGVAVFVSGLALLPFLHLIIAEKPTTIVEDIRLIYLLYIVSTASTYFFSYKISLLDADQNIALATKNSIKFSILQNVLQIAILATTHNFIFYLITQIIVQLSSNFYISYLVDKKYPYLKSSEKPILNPAVKKNLLTNVRATFLTKIGGVLVNGTDNIFISAFVGLALLGKYSNYVMLFGLVNSFLMIIFANIKSSIAHFVITESTERQRDLFRTLNFLNFLFFGIASLLIYFCINDFIQIWVGKAYVLDTLIPLLLAINFFMVGMQNGFWSFKGAYGFFKHGQYMVLLTAFINVVLSYSLGKEYGIIGIIGATAIARLVTNFWYDPYIVLKLGLKENPLQYAMKFMKYCLVLGFIFGVLHFIFLSFNMSLWVQLLLKFTLTLLISTGFIFLFFGKSVEMKESINLLKNIKRKFHKS